MSQRRGHPGAYDVSPPNERSKCTAALCMSWKFFTCVFSHVMLVALVVSYCILGAFTFEHLEAGNEKAVKRGIAYIRGNLTEAIWLTTSGHDVLHQENWTMSVVQKLEKFETDILQAMKTDGWDGNEDEKQIQWTFAGALFYSIIVITTIGYGHIAPKTHMGKVTTIFYAILGIPLMLLCLSNIGDIMASSFRFLYWRVCCFVCTREPKRNNRRGRSTRGTIRQPSRSVGRGSVRRPERFSQRSHDSGIEPSYEPAGITHAYSDTDLRYSSAAGERVPAHYQVDQPEPRHSRQNSKFNRDKERFRDRHTVERERNVGKNRFDQDEMPPPGNRRYNTTGRINKEFSHSQPPRGHKNSKNPGARSQSLDRRARKDTPDPDFDQEPPFKIPVLCNKYAIDELDRGSSNRRKNPHANRFQNRIRNNHNRSQSVPRPVYGNQLELPSPSPPRRTQSGYNYANYDDFGDDLEMQPVKKVHKRRERSIPPPSPRIMSPMGFQVHRQARYDEYSLYDDEGDSYGDMPSRSRPVPIWLCVFLVISYIIAGAFLFSKWERWTFLDSAYFCFITLTTIGFGDFVPAQGVKSNSEVSIALCSLYLLFGIALLAMSFNLVQEEVIANVKNVARRLGILKEEETED